ncbi:MAG: alkaline phosphatase family protein [Gemmatimonadetes bacterium]|nr:alkaline phosphatase family protein [Gemmatimonadota bacterium]
MTRRALLIFLDGVGIGPPDPDVNPFLRAGLGALRSLLGDAIPTLAEPRVAGAAAFSVPLDAVLGVPGVPQSGTGQTALLTGQNAPRIYGRHFGPWTPVKLRPLLQTDNLMSRALTAGHRTIFANAYPEDFLERRGHRRSPAPPLAAVAAGLLVRHADALRRGEAVASEIVNTGWRLYLGYTDLPEISPETAGRNLARIAATANLTVFAHYATDLAGHRGGMQGAIRALELVDRFLEGVLDTLPPDTLLLLASDHGNIEDVRAGHTQSPALGIVAAPGAPGAAGVAGVARRLGAITDVPGALFGWLGDQRRPECR